MTAGSRAMTRNRRTVAHSSPARRGQPRPRRTERNLGSRRAFVLSGGASLGAVQVGMACALATAGITPDLYVGTSVGAINSAWLAGHPGVDGADDLADVWRSVRRADVFPVHPLAGLLGLGGRRAALIEPGQLRRLLSAHLTFDRLEDAPVPVHVVAANVLTASDVLLSTGSALDAVAASAAIPGVLPPVTIGGVALMDGGVVNNSPISHAVSLGAEEIWVLSTGYSCALRSVPRSAMGMAMHALTVLVQHRLAVDVDRYEKQVTLHVVPPPCPVAISPVDFSHTGELIDMAYRATTQWVASGGLGLTDGQAQLLEPHDHAAAPTPANRR